ncbi:hypothetical protein PG993_011837 [Apiospora rasikravindrae]|uniref:Uncharacterized protein n=1 Tax=Apiospora rasikravindrae TaxID=990691 RepID=A0ABR1S0Q4_9PEZI
MAHQAHALPWNTLAKHYQYKMSYTHEPQRKDIFPAESGGDSKEIDYFCRALAQRVQEFAETERAKYRPQAELRERARTWTRSVVTDALGPRRPAGSAETETETRMVYPNEMQFRYLEEGHKEGADLPTRVAALHSKDLRPLSQWTDCPHGSRIGHADTVKIMMMEAAGTPPALCAAPNRAALKTDIMESLLLIANKPEAKLPTFLTARHGHRHGVCRAAEEAVRVYLYLNLLVVMQEQGSDVCAFARSGSGEEIRERRNYMDLKSYSRLLGSVAGEYDGDAQNLVHWDYFFTRGEDDYNRDEVKDVLADMEGLREYLKGVWRILVVYDLVVREAGGDPELAEMCKTTLDISFG